MIAVALHDTVFVQNVTSRHCQELPLELRTQTSGGGGETEGVILGGDGGVRHVSGMESGWIGIGFRNDAGRNPGSTHETLLQHDVCVFLIIEDCDSSL